MVAGRHRGSTGGTVSQDDPARALADQLHGNLEALVETICEGTHGSGFGFQDLSREGQIRHAP